jgi:ubiquinone/menaquinone biosynthesis C-methylase UbiE
MEAAEYDRLAAQEETLWYCRALRERAVAWLARAGLPAGGTVLDAGCGTGGMLRRLARWRSDLRLRGLDVSPLACERAAASGLDVSEGSIEHLPFADGEFAAITSLDVLTQIETPLLALLEFSRCLRPGGTLVLNGAALQWLWSYHDERVQSVQRLRRRTLCAMLREAGFVVEFASYWNCALFPLVVVRRKLFPPAGAQQESDVRPVWPPLNATLGAVAAIERGLNRAGVRFPFGSSVFVVARKPAPRPRVKLE